jgi:hypothetical protein
MPDKFDKISFWASLPPIQSAISLDGQGDGGRVKLDVPRSDVASLIRMQYLSGCTFKVTIEVLDGNDV